MSEEEILYQIKVYDDDYNEKIPDEWKMSLDKGEHYGKARQIYDFTKHRYIVEYVSDNYDMHSEIQRLQQENKQLKEQLEYLRSNEYLNQLKWERNFNEELVKDLQQENKQLKEEIDLQFKDLMKRIQENNDEYLEEKNKLIKEKHYYKKILTELESSHKNMTIEIPGYYVYDKIQELKEKYK